MSEITLSISQQRDQKGGLEEFTSDLFYCVPPNATEHLGEDGLPLEGTCVRPGMILIGKSGATDLYRRDSLPDDMEILGFNGVNASLFISKYGKMFYNASLYVPEGLYGIVKNSYFVEVGGIRVAHVVIRPMNPALLDWNRRYYGYWMEGVPPIEHPAARDCFDDELGAEERKRIMEYLRSGRLVCVGQCPGVKCQLCPHKFPNSITWLSDGVWNWPDILIHYVEVHRVGVPSAFLDHMATSNYTIASDVVVDPKLLDWPS